MDYNWFIKKKTFFNIFYLHIKKNSFDDKKLLLNINTNNLIKKKHFFNQIN